MAALLVAASLVPLTILAYVDLRQTEARLLDATKSLLAARGDQIAHELDNFHRGYRSSADRIATFPDSAAFCAASTEHRTELSAGMMGILSTFQRGDGGIRGVALLDGSGRVVIGT